jgi:hypothetical protein
MEIREYYHQPRCQTESLIPATVKVVAGLNALSNVNVTTVPVPIKHRIRHYCISGRRSCYWGYCCGGKCVVRNQLSISLIPYPQ